MPGTLSLFWADTPRLRTLSGCAASVSGATGAFLVPGAAPLKRQQRTPEPLSKRVGVDGIGEAKSYEEIFVLVASASGLDAVLAMEGQHGVAGGSEATRW
jgi:hypothetical protein